MNARLWIAPATLLLAMLGSGCTVPSVTQYAAPGFSPADLEGSAAVLLPVGRVAMEHRDRTGREPEPIHSDTFLTEAVNGLVLFAASNHFTLLGGGDEGAAQPHGNRCRSMFEGAGSDTAGSFPPIRDIAVHYGVPFVILPCDFRVRYTISRPTGWRDDRFGPSYERPVNYTAVTTAHIQVWDSSGVLLLERRATTSADRSMLYGLFRRSREREGNIVVLATRFYASPIVKSLDEATRQVFSFDAPRRSARSRQGFTVPPSGTGSRCW